MKIKSILMTALAALVLAGCSKDGEKGGGDGVPEGLPTTFKMAYTLPQGMIQNPAVRAGGEHEATTEESAIDNISIWVFNADGTPAVTAAVTDYHFQLDAAADFTTNDNVLFEMSVAKPTTSGDKRVYVGANVPAALDIAYTNEAALLAATADVQTELLDQTGGVGNDQLVNLVMMGYKAQTFVVAGYGDNEVDIDLYRASARVVTTSDITGNKWTVNFGGTNNLEIEMKGYFLVQDAHKSFLAQNYQTPGDVNSNLKSLIFNYPNSVDFHNVVNKYDPSVYTTPAQISALYTAIVPDAASETARAALDGYYIGENITNHFDDVARNGNTTYAFIQTQFTMTGGGAQVTSGNITYDGTPINASKNNGDFVLVRMTHNGSVTDYICSPEIIDPLVDPDYSEADDVAQHLLATNSGANVKLYTYEKGYVYYRVWLNSDQQADTDKYNVYRNQFIHMDITGINVSGTNFGDGYPGDEGNPEVPIDPNDGDNGNNPNPTPDPEPIDEQEATMIVNIKVMPWSYVKNGVILGR